MARTELLIVQFHIGKRAAVPKGLPDRGLQEQQPRERTDNAPATPALRGVRCGIHGLRGLTEAYTLIDAYTFQRSHDVPGVSWSKTKHYVRFVYLPKAKARPAENTKAMEQALAHMAAKALWDAEVWENPYRGEGATPDSKFVSVNLTDRRPFMGGDGKPTMEWETDAQGYRVGDGPVPLRPQQELRVEDGHVISVPVQRTAAAAQ